jgi:hypothetical protein
MSVKWTEERRKKFRATMRAKKLGRRVTKNPGPEGLPPKLMRDLEQHFRRKILAELLKGRR